MRLIAWRIRIVMLEFVFVNIVDQQTPKLEKLYNDKTFTGCSCELRSTETLNCNYVTASVFYLT